MDSPSSSLVSSTAAVFSPSLQDLNTAHADVVQEETMTYTKIGFGQCGLVFAKPFPDHKHVVKIARPFFSDGLWNDFLCHLRLFRALSFPSSSRSSSSPSDSCSPQAKDNTWTPRELVGREVVHIPRVYSYIPRSNSLWWEANMSFLVPANSSSNDIFPLPSEALITERTPPIPEGLRNELIERYCPAHLQENAKSSALNQDCLARIYLGRRRQVTGVEMMVPLLAPNFTLRNFNFCLDQMLEMGLPIEEYSRKMGMMLATIHWGAGMDGFDVEFVLGGECRGVGSDETGDRGCDYRSHITELLGVEVEEMEGMEAHKDIEVLRLRIQNERQDGDRKGKGRKDESTQPSNATTITTAASEAPSSSTGPTTAPTAPAAATATTTSTTMEESISVWVLDFNLCNRFPFPFSPTNQNLILEQEEAVINQLVLAFFENDPYYPLPLMPSDSMDALLWDIFREEYTRRSGEILASHETLQHLPERFIEGCVEREKEKLKKGFGHGHRDFKG